MTSRYLRAQVPDPANSIQWHDRWVLIYFGPEIPGERVEELRFAVVSTVAEALDIETLKAALGRWATSNDIRLVNFSDQPDHCDPLAETIAVGFRGA